jgi:eukaryotic-like serine/threonine-protein kinase
MSADEERQRWDEARRILGELLEAEPAVRDRRLEELSEQQEDLADEVRSLLAAATGAEDFFRHIARGAGAPFMGLEDPVAPADHALGRVFGAYRLLRKVGTGGMGAVYYAERADDLYRKHAAVKLLPPGLGTDGMRRRFHAERRILARLQHPKIATLLDGGISEDGVPFFVMEYVDGRPIDRYCQERKLSVHERLGLFLQACEAVEYAHRSLVVHRDLKPSNILVTPDGQVKLLDFGIAMLLAGEPGDDYEPLTEVFGAALTPAFASPEQLRRGSLTTATDVYSLGVLLYLLLTDRRPYEVARLSPSEAETVICEEDPRPPSDVAPARSRKLRGDLDTIVLTALQKEPTRRYASVRALAEDIERHLSGHPVLARRDTFGYRLSRFVGRNRLLVGATTAISLLLVVLSALALYAAAAARAQNVVIAAERDRARLESEKAEAVTGFLVSLFGASDPDVAAGNPLTTDELLERGELEADALAAQPEVKARVLVVIAQVYTELGRFERAEPLYREAITIHRASRSEPDSDLALSLGLLGEVLRRQGRFEEAAVTLAEALAVADSTGDPISRGDVLTHLGFLEYDRGDYRAAETAHHAAYEIRLAHYGEVNESTATSLQGTALAVRALNRTDEAEALHRRALATFQTVLGPEHTDVATTLNTLGRLLTETGRHAEADSILSEALRINRIRLGDEHPNVALDLNDLGTARARRGDFAAAEAVFREALRIREQTLGPDHSYVAISLNNLAYALQQQGRTGEALPLRRRAFAIAAEKLGSSHDNTGTYAFNLAEALAAAGDTLEAEALYRESIAILRRSLPEGHPLTARPLRALAALLITTGRTAEAESLLLSLDDSH